MAGSLFDGALNALFDAVSVQFGQDGFWVRAPLDEVPGRVLLKEPTGTQELIDGLEYDQARITLEYRQGVFVGLREAVGRIGSTERVRIGTRLFLVGTITAKYDGATLIAHVTEIK